MAQNCWIHIRQLVFAAILNSDVTEAEMSPYLFFDEPDREKEEGEESEKGRGGEGERERGRRERERERGGREGGRERESNV